MNGGAGKGLVALEHDHSGGDACVVGDRDQGAAHAQSVGVGTSRAQEGDYRTTARVGAYFDVVPPDVGVAAEGFGGGFFGSEAAGQGRCAIGALTQIGAFIFGQDALPNAVAEAREGGALALDR